MPFCTKCGKEIPESATFCPNCGASQNGEPNPNAQAGGPSLDETVKKLNNTPDHTSDYDSSDIANNKGMAIISYLGFLFIIPLLCRKNSRFARFHVNQGLILLIADVIVGALKYIPIVGGLLFALGGIAVFIGMILGIVNAANGRAKELPLIGQFELVK